MRIDSRRLCIKKNLKLMVFIFSIVLILTGACDIEKKPVINKDGSGSVRFAPLPAAAGASRAYTEEEVLDMAAGIVVTIVDSDNNTVYNDKFLNIFTFNGRKYPVTPPSALPTGEYHLTRFDILDGTDTIIFATPLAGSALAGYIDNPLPITFIVEKDKITNVIPEVIAARSCEPQDFGYTTFSFDVANLFDFYITFLIYDEISGNFQLTEADLIIRGDGMEIFNVSGLPAVTNRIFISEDYAEYTLIVNKAGYAEWSAVYPLAELNPDCAEVCPVIVVLTPPEVSPTPTPTPTLPPTQTPTQVPPRCGPYVVPATQTVAPGNFTVEIRANTGTQALSAYAMTTGYDPDVLQLTNVENSADAAAAGMALITNQAAGSVQVSGFTTGSMPPGTSVKLFVLSFTAIAKGTSTITFTTIDAMTDTNFADICPPFTGTDGIVIVE